MLVKTRYLLLFFLCLLILFISGAVAFDPNLSEARPYALSIFVVSIISTAGTLGLFIYQYFRPDRLPEFLHGRLDKRDIREEGGIKFALVAPPDKAAPGSLIRLFLVLENAFDKPRCIKFHFSFKSFLPGADKHFACMFPEMEVKGGEADIIVLPLMVSSQAPPRKYSLYIDASSKMVEGYGERMRTRAGKSVHKAGIVRIIFSLLIGPFSLLIPVKQRKQTSLEVIAKDNVEALSSAGPSLQADESELEKVEFHKLWCPEERISGDMEEIEMFWSKANKFIEEKNVIR